LNSLKKFGSRTEKKDNSSFAGQFPVQNFVVETNLLIKNSASKRAEEVIIAIGSSFK
jgi:hypothetical protein